MTQDDRLRELERRLAADPGDEEARLALAVLQLRAGGREAARATIEPSGAEGYRLLCEHGARDPLLLALLDEAPEWRSSGGDPGCSRWSSAAAVTAPVTAWRRRVEDIHAALAVAVDRGRAFVVTLGPRGAELVVLSVFTGETLWRFALGDGAPSAPLAREGWVYAAIATEAGLRTFALTADGAVVWRAEDPCTPGALPGALNLSGGELVLPVATSWRGSSRIPDGARRAFVIARDASTGRSSWHLPAEQVFSETPSAGGVLYAATDFVTGAGTLLSCTHGRAESSAPLGGAPSFIVARDGALATATSGTVNVDPGPGRGAVAGRPGSSPGWSTIGGSVTSLAFDGRRVVVGRGADFAVKDAARGATLASFFTHESPLPYRPRGVAHPPPAPRSAVCAGDACYLASPLAPSLAAFSVRTGAALWRHEVEGLLVPEEGPRFTWPTSEVGPPDRGPLHLAPLPGRLLSVTLSGYAFLIGSG